MSFLKTIVLSTTALNCLIVFSPKALAVSFQGLGSLSGDPFLSRANAISADGSLIVGDSLIYSNNSGGGVAYEGFVWDEVNGMTGLGDLPGHTFNSQANGISGDGSLVVGRSNGSGTEGVIWDQVNGLQSIGQLLGLTPGVDRPYPTEMFDISTDGSTVVGYSINDGAIVWDRQNGTIKTLQTPNNSFFPTQAFGVSGDGSKIVGVGISSRNSEGFIYDEINGLRSIGTLSNGTNRQFSVAHEISTDGSLVVGRSASSYNQSRSSYNFEAIIWDEIDGIQPLGYLSLHNNGSYYSEAFSVSGDGSTVVGTSIDTDAYRGFNWNKAHGMQDIESILTNAGIDIRGWNLTQINSISDDGSTIVGSGTNPDGNTEAWIATLDGTPYAPSTPVPEPLTILGSGTAIAFGVGFKRKLGKAKKK